MTSPSLQKEVTFIIDWCFPDLLPLKIHPELECCSEEILEHDKKAPSHLQRCFNIDLAKDDPDFEFPFSRPCFSFTR